MPRSTNLLSKTLLFFVCLSALGFMFSGAVFAQSNYDYYENLFDSWDIHICPGERISTEEDDEENTCSLVYYLTSDLKESEVTFPPYLGARYTLIICDEYFDLGQGTCDFDNVTGDNFYTTILNEDSTTPTKIYSDTYYADNWIDVIPEERFVKVENRGDIGDYLKAVDYALVVRDEDDSGDLGYFARYESYIKLLFYFGLAVFLALVFDMSSKAHIKVKNKFLPVLLDFQKTLKTTFEYKYINTYLLVFFYSLFTYFLLLFDLDHLFILIIPLYLYSSFGLVVKFWNKLTHSFTQKLILLGIFLVPLLLTSITFNRKSYIDWGYLVNNELAMQLLPVSIPDLSNNLRFEEEKMVKDKPVYVNDYLVFYPRYDLIENKNKITKKDFETRDILFRYTNLTEFNDFLYKNEEIRKSLISQNQELYAHILGNEPSDEPLTMEISVECTKESSSFSVAANHYYIEKDFVNGDMPGRETQLLLEFPECKSSDLGVERKFQLLTRFVVSDNSLISINKLGNVSSSVVKLKGMKTGDKPVNFEYLALPPYGEILSNSSNTLVMFNNDIPANLNVENTGSFELEISSIINRMLDKSLLNEELKVWSTANLPVFIER